MSFAYGATGKSSAQMKKAMETSGNCEKETLLFWKNILSSNNISGLTKTKIPRRKNPFHYYCNSYDANPSLTLV